MPIHLASVGHVAAVTLDSPGKLNAINVAMWREIAKIFAVLAKDPAVRCVVVRGAGGNFAAGADIAEFATVRFDQTSGRHFHLEIIGAAIEAIRNVPQTVIAAIEGYCIGGGLEIAVACDLRIATADAHIIVARAQRPLVRAATNRRACSDHTDVPIVRRLQRSPRSRLRPRRSQRTAP